MTTAKERSARKNNGTDVDSGDSVRGQLVSLLAPSWIFAGRVPIAIGAVSTPAFEGDGALSFRLSPLAREPRLRLVLGSAGTSCVPPASRSASALRSLALVDVPQSQMRPRPRSRSARMDLPRDSLSTSLRSSTPGDVVPGAVSDR